MSLKIFLTTETLSAGVAVHFIRSGSHLPPLPLQVGVHGNASEGNLQFPKDDKGPPYVTFMYVNLDNERKDNERKELFRPDHTLPFQRGHRMLDKIPRKNVCCPRRYGKIPTPSSVELAWRSVPVIQPTAVISRITFKHCATGLVRVDHIYGCDRGKIFLPILVNRAAMYHGRSPFLPTTVLRLGDVYSQRLFGTGTFRDQFPNRHGSGFLHYRRIKRRTCSHACPLQPPIFNSTVELMFRCLGLKYYTLC